MARKTTTCWLVCIALLGLPGLLSAQNCEVGKLIPPLGGDSPQALGTSVAVDGDLAIAGAPFSWSGCAPGSAVIFRFDPVTGTWLEEQTVSASDGSEDDWFGTSVAIRGDVALVGAFRDDDAGSDTGAAYIFRFDPVSGTWQEEQKLAATDASAGNWFGVSVSLEADLALVGAYQPFNGESGAAYLFRYDTVSGTWTQEQKLAAAGGGSGDRFGAAVSLDGDVALVGAPRDDDFGADSGSAYLFRHDALSGNWSQEQKLNALDAASNDRYGQAVSVDGGMALVGTPLGDGGNFETGSAYLHRYDPVSGTWPQEQKIWASDGMIGDEFATSVALDGDVAVLGAPSWDAPGTEAGAAYVFRLDTVSTVWLQEQKLTDSDGAAFDEYGISVGLSGETVVLGSPGHDEPSLDSGTATIYRYVGTSGTWAEEQALAATPGAAVEEYGTSVSLDGDLALVGAPQPYRSGAGKAYIARFDPVSQMWMPEQELIASDTVVGDGYGRSVSLDGDVAVIGADQFDNAAIGAVYVFRFDPVSSTWVEEQKLTASDGALDDRLGASVSVSGSFILVGSRLDDDLGSGSGSAYLFRYDSISGTWFESQKLTASDGTGGDLFGESVFLRGDVTIVGAYGDDDQGNTSGSAYIFRYQVGIDTWVEEQKLTASDGAASDAFGRAVMVEGDLAVVGSRGDDDLGSNSGSAYVFRRDPLAGTWSEDQKLTASDGTASDEFGRSVTSSGDLVLVGAHWDDAVGSFAGSAYLYRYSGVSSTWVEELKLTAADTTVGDLFGSSVSLSGTRALVGAPNDDEACLPLDCIGCDAGAAYVFELAPCLSEAEFVRGDCNADGTMDISDPIFQLDELFSGGPAGPCEDACDVNDDGGRNIADAVYSLATLFSGGPPPPLPSPDCGLDPTVDGQTCATYGVCQ